MDQAEQDRLLALVEAKAEFVRAIKKAKRAGVNVDACFLEVQEQIVMAWVRCFGLVLGIVYVMTAPYVPPIYQIVCFKLGMPYVLNEIYYYWPYILGILAIISFGFNLVDPRTLKRVTGKAQISPDETTLNERLSASGHYLVSKPLDNEDDGRV